MSFGERPRVDTIFSGKLSPQGDQVNGVDTPLFSDLFQYSLLESQVQRDNDWVYGGPKCTFRTNGTIRNAQVQIVGFFSLGDRWSAFDAPRNVDWRAEEIRWGE